MTEVLFYHLQRQPLERVLPVLLERSLERGWRVVVQAVSEERADALDALLWTFRDDSFLPHGTWREREAPEQPVLLTVHEHNPNAATIRSCSTARPCRAMRTPMNASWCCSMARTPTRWLAPARAGARARRKASR